MSLVEEHHNDKSKRKNTNLNIFCSSIASLW